MKQFYIVKKSDLEKVATPFIGDVKEARTQALESCEDGTYIIAECTGPVVISTHAEPVRRITIDTRKRVKKVSA